MSVNSDPVYLKKIGARILSEANDLKRTTRALSQELGRDQKEIEAVIAGEGGVDLAHQILQAMVQTYPISLADLWLEADDTDHGVVIVTEAQSKASSRVFDRPDASGELSSYYEYRDTAMSRTAPFKPEWIKELRVVNDDSPDNNNVAYNNGHLTHQTTFFVGPVNFYWQVDGKRHCAELDTGDSNYITPFVPHSFASRDADNLGLILAVTYGGDVRRALSEFAYLDGDAVEELTADPRDPEQAFVRLLNRHLAAESLTHHQFIDSLVDAGIDRRRAEKITKVGNATLEEIEAISTLLNVSPTDLTVAPLQDGREVVVERWSGSPKRYFPDPETPAYQITGLARTSLQPYLKGLEFTVLAGGGDLRHSLHQFTYNYGRSPVRVVWAGGENAVLNPGDSAYIRPMVEHRFEPMDGNDPGNLVVMRIPGGLSGHVLSEFSAYAPEGRRRVAGETKQWF